MPPKEKAAKCPVDGCKQRLNAATSGTCKQCKNLFCNEHSFPGGCRRPLGAQRRSLTAPVAFAGDHNCMRLSGGISRSASAPQLVPKAVPGVLVSSTAKPKEAQGAPGPQKVRTHCSADHAVVCSDRHPTCRRLLRLQGLPPLRLCSSCRPPSPASSWKACLPPRPAGCRMHRAC